jgi:death on curing protein
VASDLQFLSVDDVLAIHEDTIRHEGGLSGIRDLGLLISAVMMPQQQFGGSYLHDGVAAMAAAYLFHIAKHYAFNDGNKSAAILSALVFLDVNDVTQLPDPAELESVTFGVAAGEVTKDQLTGWVQATVGE